MGLLLMWLPYGGWSCTPVANAMDADPDEVAVPGWHVTVRTSSSSCTASCAGIAPWEVSLDLPWRTASVWVSLPITVRRGEFRPWRR
ncbi:hypothetical protein FB45DRAFT_947479 [Roridomyces roridus]|uniref:Uncharacterized protein n=1 Tax=Roridomyces roridus TaxID=1738132 RepID=A0AAD7B261_9AGAR|nr:hypothetical protein FB45DRAFT_947479 [Roridomyces roridus]